MYRIPYASRTPLAAAIIVVAAIAIGQSRPCRAENEAIRQRGAEIYRDQCAECHGGAGQGVKDRYEDPLVGDWTVKELSELITDTMPEEDPDLCTADDAAAVAVFIHHAFYSAAAQVRNRPPRIELTRLTANQLRQSLADIYGNFFKRPWVQEERGVAGFYFQGEYWNEKNKKIDRVDPTIDFDFERKGPGGGIDPNEYFVSWIGSLKVDQSGRYEIILRSTCSCTMSLGHQDRELINNYVQSEGRVEFRRVLNLTGGRVYPFRVDFTQRKRKTEQPPAKISLSWVPPDGVEEIIPEQHLLPTGFPPSFALQTKLPADDHSYGYDRGVAIDRSWDESTTAAALEFAQVTVDELWPEYQRQQRRKKKPGRQDLRQFLIECMETAFRRNSDESLRELYIDPALAAAEDDAEAIRRAMLMILKSPRFLYPTIDSDQSISRRAANRLALTLYDSLPSDEWLVRHAEKNQLQTTRQIRDAAELMINEYRAHAKVRGLMYQWLDFAGHDEITKDRERYPGFDQQLVRDLQASLDAFLDDVLWSESSDFRQLFQADWTYTTDRLHRFYGPTFKPQISQEISLSRSVADPQGRQGILTHPLLLSRLAYHATSSPVHRGVFLVRHVLGRTLRPPEAAFSPLNPELHPGLTTRQRVELQTANENCQVCHSKVDPLGFALEHFDAAGQFRAEEDGQVINATGHYVDREGKTSDFDGAKQLSQYLVGSRDCHEAFVQTAFKHMVKQPITAFGADTLDELTDQFQRSEFNVRQLLIDIAVIAAMPQQQFEQSD